MARSPSTSARASHGDLEPIQGGALADRLPALRAALEEQHRFRCEQLAGLETYGGKQGHGADPGERAALRALREVDAVLKAGARRAIADIELALLRIQTGRYGYCRSCSSTIPLALLEAIPKTTLCLACQWHGKHAGE